MGIMITVGIIPVCDAHQKMGVHYTWQNTVVPTKLSPQIWLCQV